MNVMRRVRMSGSLTSTNLNFVSPLYLDNAKRTRKKSTSAEISCEDDFRIIVLALTFPSQQDPCYYATHSVESASYFF